MFKILTVFDVLFPSDTIYSGAGCLVPQYMGKAKIWF